MASIVVVSDMAIHSVTEIQEQIHVLVLKIHPSVHASSINLQRFSQPAAGFKQSGERLW